MIFQNKYFHETAIQLAVNEGKIEIIELLLNQEIIKIEDKDKI